LWRWGQITGFFKPIRRKSVNQAEKNRYCGKTPSLSDIPLFCLMNIL
jgi:hypothetical protein